MGGISVTGRTSVLTVTYKPTIPKFLDTEIKFPNAMTFIYSRASYFLQVLCDQELFIFCSHLLNTFNILIYKMYGFNILT
jgi:hypothetical protein